MFKDLGGFETSDVEQWIADKKSSYAFVDLRKFRQAQRELFSMKGLSHYNLKAAWNEVYDGVFYLEQMYLSQLLPTN